ncbi:MAG TPA: hypothetical protein VGG33_19645 [Polyangia bacterium]
MTALSTAAWVAHDLSLAVGVGGSLFGRMALEPSMSKIADREERGMVVNDAWRRFGMVQLGALGVMGGTWLLGRLKLTGWEVDAESRALVVAKDVLVGTTLATAIGAAVAGSRMAAQRPEGAVPMNSEGEAAADAPPKARALGRTTDAFGLVNLLAGAGVVALTTILAMRAGQSSRWSLVSRFLP